jgi:hypothetical protein
VKTGQVEAAVDLTDWYADESAFPPKP